jgi:Flp pilus assembly protein CpaB
MVKPNDHVDVLGTFSFPSKAVQGRWNWSPHDAPGRAGLATAANRKIGLLSDLRMPARITRHLEVTRVKRRCGFRRTDQGRISLALRNPDDVILKRRCRASTSR